MNKGDEIIETSATMYVVQLSNGKYYRRGYATGQDLQLATLFGLKRGDLTKGFLEEVEHVTQNIDENAVMRAVTVEVQQ